MDFITFIKQPWPWYIAGPGIVLVMHLLIYYGKSFGVSSNLRTLCTMAGAGQCVDFFRFDWKSQQWNLVFVLGAALGGLLSALFLMPEEAIQLSERTIASLESVGLTNVGSEILPPELFSSEAASSLSGVILLLFGGFLVGFGARYAGGCTSGHAISGLSDLQWPSLIAVIGFFIGGLIMTHLLLPALFSWADITTSL